MRKLMRMRSVSARPAAHWLANLRPLSRPFRHWFLPHRAALTHKRPPQLEVLETRDLPSGMSPLYILADPIAEQPLSGTSPIGYSPGQIVQAYGFNQISFNGVAGDGTGQTIAVVDAYNQPTITSDLANFDATNGLPAPPSFKVVNQNGGSNLPPNASLQGWGLETSLDVEWAHAIAPKANILLVESFTNNDSDMYAAVQWAATKGGASVVSMSWGDSEADSETSNDGLFTQPGVTYVAASGDTGAPPIYPASSPNVLAVGGTSLSLNGNGYVSESAWSGSGGGLSSVESAPSYQQGLVIYNGKSNGMRATPDVSFNADPSTGVGVLDTYDFGGWVPVGGTSAAAPQWAGLIAIANQGRVKAGLGTLSGASQTLPDLYSLPQSDFHDITSGSSISTSTPPGPNYAAGPGYDLATGRGTPIANLIAAALVPAPTTPPATPAGLTAKAVAPDQIQLSWNADTGAAGYLIQRSPDGASWVQVSTATSLSTVLTDGDLTPATTYYYRIQANNSAGSSGFSTVASTATQSGTVNNLFADNFDGSSVNSAWKFVGGSWSQSGGVMQQTSTANGDPRKAMVTGLGSVTDVEITARVEVTTWNPGDYARAGVGLYTNTTTGKGYNLLFHKNTSTVQFLDDGVVWGNSYTFNWQVGTWYWFQLEMKGGVLYGSVWADGTSQPTSWMFTQSGWTDRSSSGAPALNGGDTGTGGSTAIFDAVSVVNPDGVSPPATAPATFTATAASSHQINLSWSDVSGETGFVIQRSPDGSTWTQIATPAAGVLSYNDSGLSASTTYYYRIAATNSGGNGPFATAQATTNAPSPPGTVATLTATAVSSSQINLSWSDASGETGFVIQRSPDSSAWTQIATPGAGVLSYSDNGLNAATTYYYRVYATNQDGSGGYSPVANATTTSNALFSDNFNGSTIGSAWTTVGGTWSQSPGVLSQTSTANGDPRKAMVTNQTFPANVEIIALVTVNSWTNGDYARAGVGLYTNSLGEGYNLLFHNNTSTVQFLDDHVTWGNSYTFNWQVGQSYWFDLAEKGGVLYGAIWAQGTTPPANWLFTQSGWTDRSSSGAPALNGGSTGAGGSTASFSSVSVINPGVSPGVVTAVSPVQVNPAGTTVAGVVNDPVSGLPQATTSSTGAPDYFRGGNGPSGATAPAAGNSTGLPSILSGLTGTTVSSGAGNGSSLGVTGGLGFKAGSSADGSAGAFGDGGIGLDAGSTYL
jgi:hypothetical protein